MSQLTAAGVRLAEHFIDRLAGLSRAHWRAVIDRVHTIGGPLEAVAAARLRDAVTAHPQSRALGRVDRAAREAVARAGLSEHDRAGAEYVAARAALALTVAYELPPADVARLYAPFDPIIPHPTLGGSVAAEESVTAR
jgi:hypothetical protein